MNKPAPKEPSMDEILSSIRQIIADDDVARDPEPVQPARPAPPVPVPAPVPQALSLSVAQIVPAHPEPEAPALRAVDEAVMAEAAAFASDLAAEVAAPADEEGPIGFDEAQLVEADDISFDADEELVADASEPPPPPRAAPVARSAPLPDPTLSADMAEQLLGPATEAAVKHTFSRLGAMSIGAPGVTLEAMMREMLRPMLKEWLDEHLPSVVERMVEREISRISRGGD